MVSDAQVVVYWTFGQADRARNSRRPRPCSSSMASPHEPQMTTAWVAELVALHIVGYADDCAPRRFPSGSDGRVRVQTTASGNHERQTIWQQASTLRPRNAGSRRKKRSTDPMTVSRSCGSGASPQPRWT